MQNLSIGNVSFNIDEYPEELDFGGEHILAIRQFPGGGIDVQALGAFDDEIKWEGTFMFQGALSRCQLIDQIRIKGEPVNLTAGSISKKVIISKFTYKYINDFNIPYSITLQPLDPYGFGSSVCGVGVVEGTNETIANPVIEDDSPAPAPAPAPAASSKATYTVVRGDCLWRIAQRYYGDGSKYPRIAQANGIRNPNLIFPGQVLTIP